MTDTDYMRLAIEKARQGIAKGQTPFGACIARDGRAIACAHNGVWSGMDITAHAEIRAIREACRVLKTVDLSGCVLYSTCEPCPMCFSASHWARISKIVFGARIADAQAAGFNELTIPVEVMKERGGSPVELVSDFMREANVELFALWAARRGRRAY